MADRTDSKGTGHNSATGVIANQGPSGEQATQGKALQLPPKEEIKGIMIFQQTLLTLTDGSNSPVRGHLETRV